MSRKKFFIEEIMPLVSAILFGVSVFMAGVLYAAWTGSPSVNTFISPWTYSLKTTTDGSGGAIITWQDYRSVGNHDIYAQRVDANGNVKWTVNGAAVSTAPSNQWSPATVSDGSGGAIITWQDYRSGNWDIYAQRIDANENMLWTSNGVAVSTAPNNKWGLELVSDGSGGAVITWNDYRSGSNYDIYAQRIDANGNVLWTANGAAVSTAPNNQLSPKTVSDGSGGAIITWQDDRSGWSDIYAQRIDANGNVLWTANGAVVSTAQYDQFSPAIVSDGSGGAIITWQDDRSGSNYDIYAQRIDANGNVLWTANGIAVSTASNSQSDPELVSDGSGGAIITWQDNRSGNVDIYAQRIDANGNVLWTANGAVVSTAQYDQFSPAIVSDGSGGAVITWNDYRSGSNYDIYAQRIDANGNVLWTANGIAVSTASNSQSDPELVSDGSGGAIIAWLDGRSGSNLDIYGQRVFPDGQLEDATPPVVSSTSPAGNAVGVAINTALAVTFSEAMDSTTINSGNFKVNGGAVAGSVNYDAANKTATFTPSANLACFTTYTATVTNGVKDMAGNAMAANFTWTFTTGEAPNSSPSAPALVSPSHGQTLSGNAVTFRWQRSTDPDGDSIIYHLYYSTNSSFTGCAPVNVALSKSSRSYYAGIAGFMLISLIFAGGARGRRKILLLIAILIVAGIFISCGGGGGGSSGGGTSSSSSSSDMSYTASGLSSGSTYYWKVTADDGNGGTTDSETRSLTTQ